MITEIRFKKGSGVPSSLKYAEPAIDMLNKILYIGMTKGEDGGSDFIKILDENAVLKKIAENSESGGLVNSGEGEGSVVVVPDNENVSKGNYSISAGYGSQAISDYSVALGYGNTAGVLGYYYSSIEFGDEILDIDGNGTGTYGPCKITLTKEKDVTPTEAFQVEYAVDDVFSIENDERYIDCGKITAIDNNIITVDSLPFSEIVTVSNPDTDDFSFIVASKPTSGEVLLYSCAYSEGFGTKAIGKCSHAEGAMTQALENYSHAEGCLSIAKAAYSHAEGYRTLAGSHFSHAEGYLTTASGRYAHVEGASTTASGRYSHAEGASTTASGGYSHAENYRTTASGNYSHAEGYYTITSSPYQHAQGKYNKEDTEGVYADIIGNGTGPSASKRKNIQTTDWSGNLWTAGNVYIGGTSQNDGKKVATEDYVNIENENITRMINNLHYYCNKDIMYNESLFVISNDVLSIDCSGITDGKLVIPYTLGSYTSIAVINSENITKIVIPRGMNLINKTNMTDEDLVAVFANLNTIVRIHEDGAVLSFNITEGAMN